MIGLARAILRVIERALSTPVPPRPARICPGCSQPLDFMCREIDSSGGIQCVRCVGCTTHSTWEWSSGVPYLLGHEHVQRASA